jgi:EpsI family protein
VTAERLQTLILIFVLLLFGAASWTIQLREPLGVDASELSKLPMTLGGWKGKDIPIQGSVEEMLNADYHVQRAYIHPVGGHLWLYVGYYGTDRGGHPEHTPWVCYPSNGWKIVEHSVVVVERSPTRRANELIVEQGGERRLVHFWYQSHRRSGMTNALDQTYDRLLGRLINGRADGSLVRLSTPLDLQGNEGAARLRLIAFGREILPHLQERWPAEMHESGGS